MLTQVEVNDKFSEYMCSSFSTLDWAPVLELGKCPSDFPWNC